MERTKQLFSDFEHSLLTTVKQAWSTKKDADFVCQLCNTCQAITKEVIKISEANKVALLGNEAYFSEDRFHLLVANYAWLPQMKSYLLLWRDTIFQTKKANVLLWNKMLSKEEFEAFQEKAYHQIILATEQMTHFVSKQIQTIKGQRNGMKNQMTEWELQSNPIQIYQQQIANIATQCDELSANFHVLQRNQKGFLSIQQLITNNIEAYRASIKERERKAKEVIQFIQENIETKVGKITTHTKHLESTIEYDNHQNAFKLIFEKELDNISTKSNISIATVGGIIQRKEIDFRRRVKQWTEAEILPLMYEVWEIMEFITDNLKMAMMNIQNRTSILAQEQKNALTEKNIREVDTPLNIFLKRTQDWQHDLDELFILIEERLTKDFKLSTIYNPKTQFLPIPLQATLNQYWFSETRLYQRLYGFYSVINQKVRQFINIVEQETTLSTSEKIVRYVQSQKIPNDNHHYTSIFLTKGYIGEAFWVERKLEMLHIKELIHQWHLGFRGSVLLHGQRFSGKTLFGEMIANRYFANNVIRLSPNSLISFNGRKFQTSYNLGAALEFIRKHSTNLESLIWIDDLELWANSEQMITESIRTLKKCIDHNSHDIFFIVSMSNWTKEHFNKTYNIDKVFQANFNLDKMKVEEIQKAILIRHGATHRILVDDNSEELTKNQLRKITNQVVKSANGNVGEALNLWATSIQQMNEKEVQFKYHQSYPMPDFINSDIGVVLSSIMMEKRTSDYRLSKSFGKAFQEKYKNIVQRLISVGLLVRHLDGSLEINDLVVNEVGRLLEKEKYLKFND